MERGGWTGRTVTLKYKLDTYEVFTRAKTFNRWIKTKSELYEAGRELLQPEWPLRIRLIGLRVTKLKDLRKKDDGIAKVRALFSLHHCSCLERNPLPVLRATSGLQVTFEEKSHT
jgi:hypothetical protein